MQIVIGKRKFTIGKPAPSADGVLLRDGNTSDLANPSPWMVKWAGMSGLATHLQQISTVPVTVGSVMGLSAVFACVRKLSTDLASLPLEVLMRKDGAASVDKTHPAYTLVHSQPNQRDTAMYLWQTQIAHCMLSGVAYIYVERDRNAIPTRLIPLHKGEVQVMQSTEDELIRFYNSKKYGIIAEQDILRINNFLCVDMVAQFNQLLGLALTADEYASLYFANGNNIQGYLASPHKLDKPSQDVALASWKENGISNQQGTSILPYGLEYKEVKGRTPQESQMVEVRNANGLEICRLFNMPPALVGFDTAAKYESVEQQSLNYVTNTLRPWAKGIEQELDRKLLREVEKQKETHSFKYNFMALLRGDITARSNYYDKMLKAGVFSINDVRGLENLNSVEGGDVHLVQVNQIALSQMDEYSKKLATTATDNTPQ